MVYQHLLVGLSLLASCRAGENTSSASTDDAVLARLVAELQRMAQSQQDRIDAYEAVVQKEVASPRQLRDRDPPSIYGGSERLPGMRAYDTDEEVQEVLTHVWLLLCGGLAVFMQAGLAMIEAGSCRVRSVQNVMLKNLTFVTASCWGWWICGWSFAYSGPYSGSTQQERHKANLFAGHEQFAGHAFISLRADGQMEPSGQMAQWFFSWAACGIATSIAGAGVAERIDFAGSFIFSLVFSSCIYPIVVGSTWGNGWLSNMNRTAPVDFAGSGIVFMSGGAVALIGALIAGRRSGRFDNLSSKQRAVDWPQSFQPQSMPLVILGSLMVWFSWYGFAMGSTKKMDGVEKGMLAGKVAMNVTIAAAGGGMIVFLLRFAMCRKYDVCMLCNGLQAGLVSISAGCSTVESGSALAISVVGGMLYALSSLMVKAAKVDDPVDAFAVYCVPGMWGMLAAMLFDWGNSFSHVHGWSGFRCISTPEKKCIKDLGLDLLAANAALIGAVLGWVMVTSSIILAILKVTKRLKNQIDVADDTKVLDEPTAGGFEYESVATNSLM